MGRGCGETCTQYILPWPCGVDVGVGEGGELKLYVCIHTKLYVCIHIELYVCIHMKLYVCIHIHPNGFCVYVCLRACVCVCV